MRKLLLLLVFLVVVGWSIRSALFTVDRTEFVYLTQFGRPVATFDGSRQDEAGLHLKWPSPIQSVHAWITVFNSSTCRGRNCSPRTPAAKPSTGLSRLMPTCAGGLPIAKAWIVFCGP